ncbi:LOW QUALITY PROTEIN: hypothetical protein JCM19038_992 [Geomicrobium sp. JCM 19038]|nr:LOW QUALITY PROTEIN: hypothetical protein JCM19038_992 [Geomicrobium sp. JCM 19038]
MGQVVPFIQNPEYFFKQGVVAYQKKDWQRSIRYLQRAIDLRPEGVFHCQLAAVLSDMGQYERSNEILLHVIEHIDYKLYDCYYFLANNYAYLGLFDRARDAANKYIQLMPDGDFREDTDELLQLLNLEDIGSDDFSDDESLDAPMSDEFILRFEEVHQFIKDQNYLKAEEQLRELIFENPSYYAAYSQLARVLHLLGRTEEAIYFLDELLQVEAYVPAICQIALLLDHAGHDQELHYWKEKLIDVMPIDKNHMYKVAATLCRLGEYEAALHAFQYLHKHSYQEKGVFFYRFGVAAFHCGHDAKTKKFWSMARRTGHEKARLLLETWEERSLSNEEVRCETVQDLAFGLD